MAAEQKAFSDPGPSERTREGGPGQRPRWFRMAAVLVLAGLLVVVAAYAWSLSGIYDRVQTVREAAGELYGGDKVSALMALTADPGAPFRLRNEACWALGQLGDTRALPLLRSLDSGEEQAEPWRGDEYLVRYTLEKAIGQIESPFSLTRWMYGWLE